MEPCSPSSRSPHRAAKPRRTGGFTLCEVGLALLALALMGYIALTEARKFQHRAQRDRFVEELRGFAMVFETYRAQRGEWPAATNAEVRIPRGMEAALAATSWLAGPPFGGSYDWMPPPRVKAADKSAAKTRAPGGVIGVTAFSPGPALALTEEDLRYIDEAIDDGNLATGRFRAGFNRWPTYLVNPGR